MEARPDDEDILAQAGYRCSVQASAGLALWRLSGAAGVEASGSAPNSRGARRDAAFVALAISALARARRRAV